MFLYLDIHLTDPARLTLLALLKRYMLTLALAMALAALEVERRRPPTEPTPIVMLTTGGFRRFPRLRPYRAHYRRRRSANGIGS